MLHKGGEHLGVGRGRDCHAGLYALRAESAQDGEHLPVSMRHGFRHALALRRSSVATCQVSACAAFIDKYQIPGWDSAQFSVEAPPCPLGFGSALFQGREGLFFGGRPNALSVRESTGALVTI